MKSHSNYFKNVFLPLQQPQNPSRTIFQDIRKQYHRQSAQHKLLKDRNPSKQSFKINKENLDDVLAETQSFSESPSKIILERELLFKDRKQSHKSRHSNTHILVEQQQMKNRRGSREQRKLSYSFHRRKRTVDSASLQRIRDTMERHPSICGKFRSKRHRTLEQNQNCQEDLLVNGVNTDKLVLWTESTLNRIIQEFYSFTLKTKRQFPNNSVQKIGQTSTATLLKNYLLSKFKTQKLCSQNFINMTYSLLHHSRHAMKKFGTSSNGRHQLLSKIRYWQIFDGILNLHFNQADIFFYLYSRHLFNQIFQGRLQFHQREQQLKTNQFFKVLSNKDQTLRLQYQKSIDKLCSQNQCIVRQSLLYFLLDDFKKNQVPTTEVVRRKKSSCKGISLEKKTFRFNKEFWKVSNSCHKIDFNLYLVLKGQLVLQCERLLQILCPQIKQQNKQLILRLLKQKSLSMLHAVSEISKAKWFKQLHSNINLDPIGMSKDFQEIQELQKQFKNIQNHPKCQLTPTTQISEFLKKLLTPRLFLAQLQQLVEDVTSNTAH